MMLLPGMLNFYILILFLTELKSVLSSGFYTAGFILITPTALNAAYLLLSEIIFVKLIKVSNEMKKYYQIGTGGFVQLFILFPFLYGNQTTLMENGSGIKQTREYQTHFDALSLLFLVCLGIGFGMLNIYYVKRMLMNSSSSKKFDDWNENSPSSTRLDGKIVLLEINKYMYIYTLLVKN